MPMPQKAPNPSQASGRSERSSARAPTTHQMTKLATQVSFRSEAQNMMAVEVRPYSSAPKSPARGLPRRRPAAMMPKAVAVSNSACSR